MHTSPAAASVSQKAEHETVFLSFVLSLGKLIAVEGGRCVHEEGAATWWVKMACVRTNANKTIPAPGYVKQ